MHTEVYANRRASAQTEKIPALKSADNYLNLLPEHRNEINNQWLSHITAQRISGNGMRILTAIYRHTIGFNKQKDDLSGGRLQQISSIRADHANHTLQALAADHAVICQDGHYGKIVSINFDFASWGRKRCEEQKITPKFISDPRYLLPKRYRDEPIDTGNIIGESLSDMDHLDAQTGLDHKKIDAPQAVEKALERDAETSNVIGNKPQVIDQLMTKLDNLEHQLQTLQERENLTSLSPSVLTVNNIRNIDVINVPAAEISIHYSQPEKQDTATNTPSVDDHANHTCSPEPEPIQTQKPIEKIIEQTMEQDIAPQITPCKTMDSLDLHYPATLDQHSRNALSPLMLKAGKHAQNILDLLAIRLTNTQNPINDIVLYCASLVRKAQYNKLDLDALNAYRASQKPKPNPKQQQMQQLQKEYQSAHADYEHFKRINEMQARNRQCSVEKYLKESGMENFWNGLVQRLEEVKQQIDQLREERG